jgi:hypothetical protein
MTQHDGVGESVIHLIGYTQGAIWLGWTTSKPTSVAGRHIHVCKITV